VTEVKSTAFRDNIMDVPQTPNMTEPITIPETDVVKKGKLSNKNFGKKLKRKLLFFSFAFC